MKKKTTIVMWLEKHLKTTFEVSLFNDCYPAVLTAHILTSQIL